MKKYNFDLSKIIRTNVLEKFRRSICGLTAFFSFSIFPKNCNIKESMSWIVSTYEPIMLYNLSCGNYNYWSRVSAKVCELIIMPLLTFMQFVLKTGIFETGTRQQERLTKNLVFWLSETFLMLLGTSSIVVLSPHNVMLSGVTYFNFHMLLHSKSSLHLQNRSEVMRKYPRVSRVSHVKLLTANFSYFVTSY